MQKHLVHFTLIVLLGFANLVNATPILTFDSREGAGRNIYTTQGVHFDAAGAFWAVSAKALAISYDGITFTSLIDGTVDLRGRFFSSSANGGLVSGQFTTFGSGPSIDLIVSDQTGLLLAGTYGKRIINGIIGTSDGNSQSTFNADSGSLAALFPSEAFSGRMVNSFFGVTPGFSSTSFSQNFDGDIDGIIFAVPEPSSLALFSIGALVVFCYMNFRNKWGHPLKPKVKINGV